MPAEGRPWPSGDNDDDDNDDDDDDNDDDDNPDDWHGTCGVCSTAGPWQTPSMYLEMGF